MSAEPNDLEETRGFRLYIGGLVLGLALLSYVLMAVSEGEAPLSAIGKAVAVALVVGAVTAIARIVAERRE